MIKEGARTLATSGRRELPERELRPVGEREVIKKANSKGGWVRWDPFTVI